MYNSDRTAFKVTELLLKKNYIFVILNNHKNLICETLNVYSNNIYIIDQFKVIKKLARSVRESEADLMHPSVGFPVTRRH